MIVVEFKGSLFQFAVSAVVFRSGLASPQNKSSHARTNDA
jgi:hypothetical protein